MIDPFFQYLSESDSPSRDLYFDQGGPKKYRRSPIVALPLAEALTVSITDALMKRRSSRQFGEAPLLLEDISSLLFWSFGIMRESGSDNRVRRSYPSGGAKYALEVYPLILRCDAVPPGVYHYDPKEHVLEHLFWVDHCAVQDSVEEQFVSGASMFILISFVKSRHVLKYGNFGYKLGLLEAGHAAQNVYLLASTKNMGCCARGVRNPPQLNALLAFDGINETVCYALALGPLY